MSSLFTGQPRNFNGTCTTTPDATLVDETTPPGVNAAGEHHTNDQAGLLRHSHWHDALLQMVAAAVAQLLHVNA